MYEGVQDMQERLSTQEMMSSKNGRNEKEKERERTKIRIWIAPLGTKCLLCQLIVGVGWKILAGPDIVKD